MTLTVRNTASGVIQTLKQLEFRYQQLEKSLPSNIGVDNGALESKRMRTTVVWDN